MTQIAGRDASELADSEVHADVILELMEKLQKCDRNQRPALLADFLTASSAFPERIDMRHSDLDMLMIKQYMSKSGMSGSFPQEVEEYIIKDEENGGPIARLVNLAEVTRRKNGLISPFQAIFRVCRERREQRTGTNIQSLDDFLEEVKTLEKELLSGKTSMEVLPLTFCNLMSGKGRIEKKDEILTVLEKSGLEPGTLVDLGGGFGFSASSFQEYMRSKGKSFRRMYLYDIGQEEELGSHKNLYIFNKNGDYTLWIPDERDRKEAKNALTGRRFGFDLRSDNLVKGIPEITKTSSPIYYSLQNVTSHYDLEANTRILERTNDIANATGEEPTSFLYTQAGLCYNPDLLSDSIIHLNTGKLLFAPGFGLDGDKVQGTDDPPFLPDRGELVSLIKAKKAETLETEKRYDRELAMSDERYQELCEKHGLGTGKYQYSDMDKTWAAYVSQSPQNTQQIGG